MNQASHARGNGTPAIRVRVSGYAYLVKYDNGNSNSTHIVRKDKSCNCAAGAECQAVQEVQAYLRAGGERAPEIPPGFWPFVPGECPVCGAACSPAPEFNSSQNGRGWRCEKAGLAHYFWARSSYVRQRGLQYVAPRAHGTTGPGGAEHDQSLNDCDIAAHEYSPEKLPTSPRSLPLPPSECQMCGRPTLQSFCSHDCEAEAKFHGW